MTHGNAGIPKTDAHKKAIGDGNRGKKYNEITKNLMSKSKSNTRWITKDNVNKRIQSEDLQKYIDDGWILGKINKQYVYKGK